jgi:hypothetical protein
MYVLIQIFMLIRINLLIYIGVRVKLKYKLMRSLGAKRKTLHVEMAPCRLSYLPAEN